ncbi:FtsX-like permease family protein [Bacteroidota bacterium]
MSTEYFIAKRYLFTKRKLNFITIISIISIVGVTIGVAAMIIVLSVFNGFNAKVSEILVGFDPHIRIESKTGGKIENYESLIKTIHDEGIESAAPYTLNKGMLANNITNTVLYIKGVDENKVDKVSGVKDVVKLGEFNLQDKGDFGGIVLGISLADKMRCIIGDTLTLLSPVGLESSLTQFVEPLTKDFIVSGIFVSDNKDYDSKYAYISIENAQYLFNLDKNVSGIEMRLDNIDESDDVKTKLQNLLGSDYNVMTWYDLNESLYSLLKIERWVTFTILSLIIAVASFNILASLTMTVIEKKRDIGVLKAMGASNKIITKIFLFEGIAVGVIGMVAGSLIGLLVILAQKYFEFYTIDSSVYQFDALPVELRFTDFIFVPFAAFILCFLASLYPSRKAAKLDPIESIRWE